jgi:flagellar motor switch protein FliN
VAETIEYEQFEQSSGPAPADGASPVDLSRLSDIPMELSVEIGRTHMTVGETLDLRVGSVVTLERLAGESADLLVNGSAIARGEVVVIDEQYGLRITEILEGRPDPELRLHSGVIAAAGPDSGGSREGSEQDALEDQPRDEKAGNDEAGDDRAAAARAGKDEAGDDPRDPAVVAQAAEDSLAEDAPADGALAGDAAAGED